MLQFTESAIAAVHKLAAERGAEGQLLRVFVQSGGCSGMEYGMEFAHPRDTDERFAQDGLDYLVDRKSLKVLDGSEIDFDDGLTGKGFDIRNPNASSTCGCGKSFG
jgi:iron-sulfur cluster assembly protein/iron-sulfur cluster insertion protein